MQYIIYGLSDDTINTIDISVSVMIQNIYAIICNKYAINMHNKGINKNEFKLENVLY